MSTIPLRDIEIIMGGMGVYISTPSMAKKVSMLGGLGTVSGTAAERIMVSILSRGDPGGHFRRALEHFPFQDSVKRILKEFYIEQGDTKTPRRSVPVYSLDPSKLLIDLIICANFAFAWLAKEGHDYPISINYLEKISMPIVHAITGAMLAGVDVITMGAGLPLDVPPLIDQLIEGRVAEYPIPIVGEKTPYRMQFDPGKFFGANLNISYRPSFIPIISSNSLAEICKRRLRSDHIQGFGVEGDTAGGHNARPRGQMILNDSGEPVYGSRDRVDYLKLATLGFPFWIAGSYASPEKLAWAKENGARGVQLGTIFAFSNQSGMDPVKGQQIRRNGYRGEQKIFTDPFASPTGYPFKVAVVEGTLSEKEVYESRKRRCSQGALVVAYRRPNGSIGYRCSAEDVGNYVKKGGKLEDTVGVKCICNGLMATAGVNADPNEPKFFTAGDDLNFLPHLMSDENDGYDVEDVFRYMRSMR